MQDAHKKNQHKRVCHFLGRDIVEVCTFVTPLGGRACVVFLSCCSIFARCFRTSSSLSFTLAAITRSSEGEGRQAGGGCARWAKTASSVFACIKRCRTQLNTTRPTRYRYGIPIQHCFRDTWESGRETHHRKGICPILGASGPRKDFRQTT